MAAITRTSPLDLRDVRKTQRRVAALLHVPDQSNFCIGRRRRRIPAGFCHICGQLHPHWGKGAGAHNPYRHLLSKGFLLPCPLLTPAAPHPTFVESDEDDEGIDEDGSWSQEESEEGGGGGGGGGMFDTTILRDEDDNDPRKFSLPPVFAKQGEQHPKEKRRSKNSRLVPMVSENTFLSTNKRGQGQNDDLDPNKGGDDLHLPRLTNQRASLVATEGKEEGGRRRKEKDPRRLHSERIDRRVPGLVVGERTTRSDSALDLDLSREKTDPPPQPILVSIRNQDGEVLHKTPLENLAPGTIPSEAFVNPQGKTPRKKREKKRRPRSPNNGSASPSFSGSISISRETTLSVDSPDYFLSMLRSASWCECPEHRRSESRCGECRRVRDHEKWCVSRNSVCQNCGKAFKRKYSQMERKSSFSTIPSSGMMISNVSSNSMSNSRSNIPHSGSPSKNRHQNCSPTKTSEHPSLPGGGGGGGGSLTRETSNNHVRFNEGGEVVYPQKETFPDSGLEGDKDEDDVTKRKTKKGKDRAAEGLLALNRSYLPSVDPGIHQRAYSLALAEAKLKAMFSKKKSKSLQHPNPGVYFSYFPLLKRKPQAAPPEMGVTPTSPRQTIGLRADVREGKQLKVKKGLKHIMGAVKVEDYYPGGKSYPKHLA